MKFNPYRPNDIIHPGMFVGRIDELNTIEKCLFQTRHGSPHHFLVQGERGIGKSSLLFIVNMVATGYMPAADDTRFNFLTVVVDLGGCADQADIIRKIGRGLRKEISKRHVVKERAKATWEWLSNWEILGVSYKKSAQEMDVEEIAEQFVDTIAELCDALGDTIDGVLFLIDEADRPPAEAGLGTYLKIISERLRRSNCDRVVFGLAGLPTLLTKLRESHESSPRLFQTVTLDQLETHERISVIERGIEEANQKNEVQTSIEDGAMKFLAELSEGYPHFVQQFSFSAFDHDSDDNIDIDDVGEGAFKQGGALSQLGDKYFSDMYHSKIQSDDYRIVLHEMAKKGDGWVSRKDLITTSKLTPSTVTNALNALKAREIIIADESRKNRGFYRLPTKSFAVWINAFRSLRESGVVPDEGTDEAL